MRWWRRNEGFDWKEYVRTTVLVRRQNRRAKIEAAKAAAVDGVKEAGRKGLAAGAAGAEAAGNAALKVARAAAEGASGGAETGLALLVRSLAAVRHRIASVSGPLNGWLARPRVATTFAISTLFLITGFMVRFARFGLDRDAVFLGATAVVAAAAWMWPRVFSSEQDSADEWAARTERAVAMAGRAQPFWPIAAAAFAAVAGLWLATPMLTAWVASVPPSSERPEGSVPGQTGTAVEGPGRAAGPGLLKVGRKLVRLDGIRMLDAGQTCLRPGGPPWDCGASAKQYLDKLVRSSRTVRCSIAGESDGVPSGSCWAGGVDIAADLVRQGFAFSDGVLFSSFADEEAAAKSANAGLWAGEPEHPDEWRERAFREAAAAAPGNCPIKGRVQSGRKIYSLPYQPDYARITVREKRGDRWFCSAVDAQRAGFAASDSK